ncbi:MAG: DNA polymerase I [Dysgonamonadaceae bacterium]|jgi:DNA polymerase-1|nr:DNA polymerase I [Dysgonamonadaceae bacterium]
MKLFLLDAYALIYRAYYAFMKMPRINSKGVNTSAIFGFVNTLEDLLRKENPSHIGIAFDPAGPTFRHEIYEYYKAHREETPEVIRTSIPIIKDIIRAYRIPILEVPNYEADDVIGTIARLASAEFEVYMMTPDKDYAQLVTDKVFIYRPKYGSNEFYIIGVEEVKKKYQIENPLQMIDLLGLMGDKSDNIPGCSGVGEVTAQKLISEFGSIKNLLANTDKLQGSLKTKVEDNIIMIELSQYLATIKTDVPIDYNPEELRRKPLDEQALKKILEELEFRQLFGKIFGETKSVTAISKKPQQNLMSDLFENIENITEKNNAPKQIETSLFPEETTVFGNLNSIRNTNHNYYLLKTEAEIILYIEKIKKQRMVSFDTETTDIDPFTAELVGMSFALSEGDACYVPVPAEKKDAEKITSYFKEILESKAITKIGQNLKYDMNVMKKYNIRLDGPLFDTMIAHYLINPAIHHNLDYLAETYLNYHTIHIEELIGQKEKGKNQLNMRQLEPSQIVNYAAEDADVALRLKAIFEKEIEENNFSELFYNIEMPLVKVLADMEESGVRLDTYALKLSSDVLNDLLVDIEKTIYTLAGLEFNINSPKVVGEVLFDTIKIDLKAKKTKNGHYHTGEEILEKLKSKHPAVEKILTYRKIRKLLSTYTEALPELISPLDGKVHTTYNQTIASTGRLSSTNPNLQNIPVREGEGREIRKAFIPDAGCHFLSADYSQIELRIMAHLSQDENMLAAFRSGQDIHAATAAKINNIPIQNVTREMRSKAKSANFGIIYGISAFGLSEQLHIHRIEAKELIDGYFHTYPGVKAYMDACIEIARKEGYVETIFHRKRYLPDISSHNGIVRGYAERNAINAPIQGSAADIIKVAMNNIHRRFAEEHLRSRMIMQVHDELNFNVLSEELETVRQIVVYEMENAVSLLVPLVADCGTGKNWLEAH